MTLKESFQKSFTKGFIAFLFCAAFIVGSELGFMLQKEMSK